MKRPLTWQGLYLVILLGALGVSIYAALITFHSRFLFPIPARGGTLTEGVLGAPHLINPVLASTSTDQELVSLIYSGLMKKASSGELVPDLAESFEVSSDGRTYTFYLRTNLRFSDNTPLTAHDVAVTIAKRAVFEPNSLWQGVRVDTPDDHTVVFELPTAQSNFPQYTTLGILPAHIWSDISDEAFEADSHNLSPVGSGPFRIRHITEHGGVVESVTLSRNTHYIGPKSYLARYHINFYANQQDLAVALQSKDIDLTATATAQTAHTFEKLYRIDRIPTTRLVGLFETTTTSFFTPPALSILNQSIDKAGILATIEYGYGTLLDAQTLSVDEARTALHSLGYSTTADGTLEKNGTPIRFSIAVENNPTTLATAQAFVSELHTLGIDTTLKAFDPGRFQDAIQQTQYQFFFGTIPERDIPTGYHVSIPLYYTALPLVRDERVHLPISNQPLDHFSEWYAEQYTWYVRIDKVWKVFTS